MRSETQEEVHILVVGTGAVGGFYGSRLHQPGRKRYVSFVCRSNFEQISRDGLKIQSKSYGNYQIKPFKVFKSIEQASQEVNSKNPSRAIKSWNFVILSTKVLLNQIDDSKLIESLFKDQDQDGTCLILIQNGIGFEQVHRNRFPKIKILSAVTIINAEQIQSGLIRHNSWTRISVGPFVKFSYDQPIQTTDSILEKKTKIDLKMLIKLFEDGGIRDAESYSERDLQILRWHKLAINASMNPTSILSGGLPNTEMVTKPHLREHLKETMIEILEAGKKIYNIQDYPIKLGTPEQVLNSTERVGRLKKEGKVIKPSMLIDWENGKALEIEAILGLPIKISERFGVRLNRVHAMYAFLTELQSARDQSRSTTKPFDHLKTINPKL